MRLHNNVVYDSGRSTRATRARKLSLLTLLLNAQSMRSGAISGELQ